MPLLQRMQEVVSGAQSLRKACPDLAGLGAEAAEVEGAVLLRVGHALPIQAPHTREVRLRKARVQSLAKKMCSILQTCWVAPVNEGLCMGACGLISEVSLIRKEEYAQLYLDGLNLVRVSHNHFCKHSMHADCLYRNITSLHT